MSISNNLIQLQETIKTLFDGIDNKITELNKICKKIRNQNSQSKYVMGLDTLYFQITLYSDDYKNLESTKNLIFNRIYCNHYKIYKRILEYVEDNVKNKEILDAMKVYKSLPVYNNLDLHHNYGNDNINKLHNHNIKVIELLEGLFKINCEKVKEYKKYKKSGLDLDGFIFAYNTNINLIKMNTDLFRQYMMYYNQIHINYLNKFIKKLHEVHNDICDTNGNEPPSPPSKPAGIITPELNHDENKSQSISFKIKKPESTPIPKQEQTVVPTPSVENDKVKETPEKIVEKVMDNIIKDISN